MKQSQERFTPQHNTRNNRITAHTVPSISPIKSGQNRNNSHILIMLLMQVILTVLLNVPYIAIYLFWLF
jgi:hypothetical protein